MTSGTETLPTFADLLEQRNRDLADAVYAVFPDLTLTFGALGLLVAARPRTLEGASGLMNFIMLPMWVGSGVFFAATNFPDAVQPLVQALPLTAVVDAMRLNMLQGGGFAAVSGELAIMGAWLVTCFVVALRIFRWR